MLDIRISNIYKNRSVLLPWVKDFEDPLYEIRNLPIGKNGTDDLPWIDWFFCHPSAYRLMTDALFISGTLTTFIIATIGYIWWNTSFAILFYIISSLFAVSGVIKGRKWRLYYGKTFYDTQMRDYPEDFENETKKA